MARGASDFCSRVPAADAFEIHMRKGDLLRIARADIRESSRFYAQARAWADVCRESVAQMQAECRISVIFSQE